MSYTEWDTYAPSIWRLIGELLLLLNVRDRLRPLGNTLYAYPALNILLFLSDLSPLSYLHPVLHYYQSEAASEVHVTPELDLILSESERLRIDGIEIPDTPEARARAHHQLSRWVKASFVLYARPYVHQERDRWNRYQTEIFLFWLSSERKGIVHLGQALIEKGLVRAQIDSPPSRHQHQLLAAERRARQKKLGLWQDPAYQIFFAGDPALSKHIGRQVLVEGCIERFYKNRQAVYGYFALPPSSKRSSSRPVYFRRPEKYRKQFQHFSLPSPLLRKYRIQVRSILWGEESLRMDISTPSQIEVMRSEPCF